MKHVIFPVIFAVTIPVWAADQSANKPADPATGQADSPLVAAAKRTNRLNKKPAFVITNETLAQMNGGRITTTSAQQPIAAPGKTAEPTPEMAAAEKSAKAREEAERVAAQAKRLHDQRMAKVQQRASQYEEDSLFDTDPAAAEHAMETLSKPGDPQASTNTTTPAQSSYGNQKPPQN